MEMGMQAKLLRFLEDAHSAESAAAVFLPLMSE